MKYMYSTLAAILIAVFLYFMGNDIYTKFTKKGANSSRLTCHKSYKTFEKVYEEAFMDDAQTALLSGEYTLTSSIQKAKFMKSKLFDYVQLKDVDQNVRDAIAKHKRANIHSDTKVQVDYYIYENDKLDPGKKTAGSKLFAGYLRFSFTFHGKKVYMIQSDFMDLEGSDIQKSVECAIESFVTL